MLSLDCRQMLRYQFILCIATARTCSSPATERSDDRAPGNWRDSPNTQNMNKKRDNNRASEDRLRDLPEWLEEFTDNLEDTEVPAHAHISQDSDSERLTKVAPRKHSIFTHFPKDPNCEVCLRTKMTKGSLQKTHLRCSTSSRKVW